MHIQISCSTSLRAISWKFTTKLSETFWGRRKAAQSMISSWPGQTRQKWLSQIWRPWHWKKSHRSQSIVFNDVNFQIIWADCFAQLVWCFAVYLSNRSKHCWTKLQKTELSHQQNAMNDRAEVILSFDCISKAAIPWRKKHVQVCSISFLASCGLLRFHAALYRRRSEMTFLWCFRHAKPWRSCWFRAIERVRIWGPKIERNPSNQQIFGKLGQLYHGTCK